MLFIIKYCAEIIMMPLRWQLSFLCHGITATGFAWQQKWVILNSFFFITSAKLLGFSSPFLPPPPPPPPLHKVWFGPLYNWCTLLLKVNLFLVEYWVPNHFMPAPHVAWLVYHCYFLLMQKAWAWYSDLPRSYGQLLHPATWHPRAGVLTNEPHPEPAPRPQRTPQWKRLPQGHRHLRETARRHRQRTRITCRHLDVHLIPSLYSIVIQIQFPLHKNHSMLNYSHWNHYVWKILCRIISKLTKLMLVLCR